MVLMIEKKLEYQAADVEWAYDSDKLYILQARQFTRHYKSSNFMVII